MSTRFAGLAIVALAFAACTPKDEAATDSTGAAAATSTAPAALTAAQIAGTWSGTTIPEGTDTVANRFTVVARPEGGGMFIQEGATDSVSFSASFDGDSSIVTSMPYSDRAMPAGSPQVTFRAIARMMGDNKMGGTTTIMLANRPDSIVGRARWEATRQ